MHLFSRHKTNLIAAADALPGPRQADAGPRAPRRARHPDRAAVPRGPRDRRLRPGLLLGRGARVLAGARRLHDRGRLRRRLHAEPDLRGGLQRRGPATPRSCSSSSTRSRSSYDELLKLFWESHDPTQGMRQGNDVGTQYRSAIYTTTDAQREAAEAVARRCYQERADAPPATARSRPRSPPAGAVLLRRGLPPAVPREEPGGYCGLGGTGVSCPSASASRPPASEPSGAERNPPGGLDRLHGELGRHPGHPAAGRRTGVRSGTARRRRRRRTAARMTLSRSPNMRSLDGAVEAGDEPPRRRRSCSGFHAQSVAVADTWKPLSSAAVVRRG